MIWVCTVCQAFLAGNMFEILEHFQILKDKGQVMLIILFVLMLYIPANNFQSCQANFLSSWVEPVLNSG